MVRILDLGNCIQENERTGQPVKIVPNWVVNELIDKLHIITVIETGDVLKYENGVYVGNGMQLVEQTLARELGDRMDGKGNPMYNKKVKGEIIDLLMNRTYVHQNEFDSDLNIINMRNGLYNWREDKLIPHAPEYLSIIQVPIKYNPEATCDTILEVMREIIQPDDFIKMQEFIAHIFYRHYAIRKAFILYGPSQTGKSVFLNMLDHMVGKDNCSAIPFDEIDKEINRAALCNKLMNKCGELDNAAIKRTLVFKDLTSGFDPISARHLYHEPFKYVNFANLIWATNSIPRVLDDTDGFYSRIEILPFLRKFKPSEYDQSRLDAMIDPDQLSGLFNVCIKRLGPLLERHEYTNSTNVEDIRERYRATSDPIQTFSENYIIRCPDGKVPCDEIYDLYVEHCEKYRVKPLHIHTFENRFIGTIKGMKQGSMKIGNKKICTWEGIKLV